MKYWALFNSGNGYGAHIKPIAIIPETDKCLKNEAGLLKNNLVARRLYASASNHVNLLAEFNMKFPVDAE